MTHRRWLAAASFGAVCAACLVAPAIGAPDISRRAPPQPVSRLASVGPFTPAAPDPKLAALLARSGIDVAAYRFTPSESRRVASRAVTVAVRARTSASVVRERQAPPGAAASPIVAPTVGLVPIAYNLGVAVGWKRFALSGDVARIDLAGAPGSREAVEAGVSYTGRRLSGRLSATAERPLPGSPRLIEGLPSYSIDVGGAFAVSRKLSVTAGVRYKTENFRLSEPSDTRRDSQAAYVGTVLRF